MEIRPTTDHDLPRLHGLFIAALAGVFEPHRLEPQAPPLEIFVNQQRHLLATGADCVVAETDGATIGFASAWTRGDDWFLASLFVDPSAQAAGVGAALLDAVWEPGARRRRTITDAIQPVSNVLYGRRGLIPVTPILTFEGAPRLTQTCALEPAELDAVALARLDESAYGFDRAVDHAYWSGLAPRLTWLRGGEPAAYAYVSPGHVGPLAAIDGDAAADALRGALAQTPHSARVRVPGSCRELVGEALAQRLRLGPSPQYLLLSATAEPPTTLAIAGATLF